MAGETAIRNGFMGMFNSCLALTAWCVLALPAWAEFSKEFPGKGSKEAWHKANIVCEQGIEAARKKDFRTSETLFRKSIQLYPDDALTHFDLGRALLAENNLESAEISFKKSIELKPVVDNWSMLGVTLCMNRKFDKAKSAFTNALKYASNAREKAMVEKNIQELSRRVSQARAK